MTGNQPGLLSKRTDEIPTIIVIINDQKKFGLTNLKELKSVCSRKIGLSTTVGHPTVVS
jgi:hypothetical protein